jgi:hypothetical protein
VTRSPRTQPSGFWRRLAVDQHLGQIDAFAQHAVVNRQQIPGHARRPKPFQSLLDGQPSRHRRQPALDHHGHRSPSKQQPHVGQGDQGGNQPEQQPGPAGQPQLAGRGPRGASATAAGVTRLVILGRAGRRLQPTTPMSGEVRSTPNYYE